MNNSILDKENMKDKQYSNGITKRQNEDYSISLLAAQRQLYIEAGRLDYIDFILSVLIPLLLAILKCINNSTVVVNCSYILSIAMLFISIFISRTRQRKKSLAALIQLKFDLYVYQMPWDYKLFGENKDIDPDVAKYSKRILMTNSEKEKLVNWYTPAVDCVPLNDGILMCQKENCNWDSELRKRYKITSIIGILIIVGIVLAIGFSKDKTISDVTAQIIFIIPILRWLLNLIAGLSDDIGGIQTIFKRLMLEQGIKTTDYLLENERLITVHRSNSVKIPDRFYNLFKNNDEKREHFTAQLELHNKRDRSNYD